MDDMVLGLRVWGLKKKETGNSVNLARTSLLGTSPRERRTQYSQPSEVVASGLFGGYQSSRNLSCPAASVPCRISGCGRPDRYGKPLGEVKTETRSS